MNTPRGAGLCLPSKNNLMHRLRKDGYRFGSVLDVGVHTATRELMDHFNDVPQLLCEPVAEFHDTIRKNYDAAGVDFILEPRAVSSKTGQAELEVEAKRGGHGITHSSLQGGLTDTQDVRVIDTVTLDESVTTHQMTPPFLLKIDVDGFELDVLDGASQTLEQAAVVIIEASFSHFSAYDAALAAKGLRLYDVIDICYHDGKFWQCDLVFFNEDIARDMGVVRKNGVEDLSQYRQFIPEQYTDGLADTDLEAALGSTGRAELENYRLLVPADVQALAKQGPLTTADWRAAAWDHPFKVTRWNALRRAARRLAKGR